MNFHTVAMCAGILAVECRGCGRRTCLTKQDGLPIFQGNMDLVRGIKGKLKCRKCGSKEIRAYAPSTKDDAQMFAAGDPLPDHTRAI